MAAPGGNGCPKQLGRRWTAGANAERAGTSSHVLGTWQLVVAVNGGTGLCHSWELLLTKGLQCQAEKKLKRGRQKGTGQVFRPVS